VVVAAAAAGEGQVQYMHHQIQQQPHQPRLPFHHQVEDPLVGDLWHAQEKHPKHPKNEQHCWNELQNDEGSNRLMEMKMHDLTRNVLVLHLYFVNHPCLNMNEISLVVESYLS
jgi:hypothetical protein